MPAADYVELDDLKGTLELQGGSGYNFADEDLSRAITAASRGIDNTTRRRYWLDADANQVRYYSPDDTQRLRIDDLTVLTSVAIDDGTGTFPTTWTENTEFVLEPLNGAADGEPYEEIVARGRYALPRGSRTVKVTGKFGWPAIPAAVVDATTIIATKLAKRKREAPFGVLNVGLEGMAIRISRYDPDVTFLLEPLMNWGG